MAASLLLLVCACGPQRVQSRAAQTSELQNLLSYLRAAPAGGAYRALGHARFESPDGEVEGDLELRVDPPRRAWAQLRTKALFSLIGERVEVSLPGDGYLLVYQQREDALERLPFEESAAADFSLGGGVQELLGLLSGQIGWPRGATLEDLDRRTRVLRSDRGGEVDYRIELPPSLGPGHVVLRLQDDVLRRLEWWVDGGLRLEVQYDRHDTVGAARRPGRVRIHAPQSRMRADVSFQRLESRSDFEARDFEVGLVTEPSPRRPS